MAEQERCQQCGAELPVNAPGGVCPKCMMKLGLPTGLDMESSTSGDDAVGPSTGATPSAGFVPPTPEELGKKLPGLEILELIGHGGMGAVYKARQSHLDRIVALKIMSPEVGRDPAFAERFTREARSLAKLNHPNIVTLFEFDKADESLFYLIMELVDGADLRHVMRSGDLTPSQALAIVPQICDALQYAHGEGFVHRDIKPENIMLDKNGRVKITDFGLAKLLEKQPSAYTLTQTGQRMGTPHYMAPEQIETSGQVDHRADIYSLGVVFYEMLTGRLPIGRFAPPSQNVHVDVRLDDVVLKSLEHDPERRYQHASEVKTDVDQIAHSQDTIEDSAARQGEKATTTQERSHSESTDGQSIPSIGWIVSLGFLWILVAASVLLGQTVARTQPLMFSLFGLGGWHYPLSYRMTGIVCVAMALTCFFIYWFVHRKNLATMQARIAGGLAFAVSTPVWYSGHFLLLMSIVLFLGRKVARTQPVRYHFFGVGGWLEPFTYNTCFHLSWVASCLCFVWAWRKGITRIGLKPDKPLTGGSRDESAGGDRGGTSIEEARRRLRIPCIGLFICGVIDCLVIVILPAVFALLGGALGPMEWIICALCLGVGLLAIAAAIAMTNLRSYSLALVGSIVAMIPPAPGFVLGLPMGIWALVVLSRANLHAAFRRNRKRLEGAARQGDPAVFVGVSGAVIIVLSLLTPLVLTLLVIPRDRRPSRPGSMMTRPGAAVLTSKFSAQPFGGLDFPTGTWGYLEFGPQGPTLTDQCAQTLDLKPSERLAVNELLQSTYAEYLVLEAQHTTRERSGDHVEAIIMPFREQALPILERFWDQLDATLDSRKQDIARRHLPLAQVLGAFHFGEPIARLTIDRQSDLFIVNVEYEWPEGSGKSGGGSSGRTGTLPQEYQRFWNDSD